MAWLRHLWDRIPPRDNQPLLKYVVYRLEGSGQLAIAAVRRRILIYAAVFLFFWAGLSLTLPLLNVFALLKELRWINAANHTLIETFGSIISMIIGLILAWEYLMSGKPNILFLVLAFFSISIFNLFHAFADHSHNLFVWYHSFAALMGSLFFFVSAVVSHDNRALEKNSLWIRRFSIFAGALLIVISAEVFHLLDGHIPEVLTVTRNYHIHVSVARGQFNALINAVNYASCVLYLLAGILFVRGFRRSDDLIYLIFGTSALLFSVSQFFFPFSELWNPLWWYWHIIVAIIFSSLLVGLAYGFTKSFYRLDASRIQMAHLLDNIERKNLEIEKVCITLKETQKYLSESEKLASIGKMAAMMAHEIRNPLGAISNSVGILKKYSLRPEETSELLNLVEDEMERLNKLTEDFLSFARPSRLNRKTTDLQALLAETLSLMATEETRKNGVAFRTSLSSDIPLLMLDRNHIKQVFINILMNSIQALPDGGTITIRTVFRRQEGEVEITFSDTGTGMTKEELSMVFQPFFTSKDKGLGLGINIVNKIVKEHGGYILLSSTKGVGTDMKVSLPADARDAARITEALGNEAADAS